MAALASKEVSLRQSLRNSLLMNPKEKSLKSPLSPTSSSSSPSSLLGCTAATEAETTIAGSRSGGCSSSYDAISISFIGKSFSSEVVQQVYEESMRVLKPGGKLFVIDYEGRTVEKSLDLLLFLERYDQEDEETMAAYYEAGTFRVLEQQQQHIQKDDPHIFRWIGTKPSQKDGSLCNQ